MNAVIPLVQKYALSYQMLSSIYPRFQCKMTSKKTFLGSSYKSMALFSSPLPIRLNQVNKYGMYTLTQMQFNHKWDIILQPGLTP